MGHGRSLSSRFVRHAHVPVPAVKRRGDRRVMQKMLRKRRHLRGVYGTARVRADGAVRTRVAQGGLFLLERPRLRCCSP